MSSIRVTSGGKTTEIPVLDSETLLAALRRAGYSIPAACGGRGRCGKCRVPVNGVPRLACKLIPQDGDEVALPEQAGGVILTDAGAQKLDLQTGQVGLAAAVDLGTTTVVARLYDRANGALLHTASVWNAQAPYGADVISRIQYTLERETGLAELSERIREQVWTLLQGALTCAGRRTEDLREVVLAGNTVMQHIFDGRSVAGIAAVPFRPETLFHDPTGKPLHGVPVRFAPCVAGYIGGDITAGLLASGLAEHKGNFLFLDIGTNGEMALGDAEGFLCCAVASGPAFEGAGITCGMPGIDGAVSHVRYDRGFLYDVVGNVPPKGLCGSGLLDLAAVLLERGIIAPGGRLLPPEDVPAGLRRYVERDADGNGLFRLTPEVYLTAADVRSLQLGKAAVAAGIQVLLEQKHLAPEQLDGVYLAGGFGNYLDVNSAIAIGMFPAALAGRIHSLGNSALAGASALALDGRKWAQLGGIAQSCKPLVLSGSAAFNAAFARHMAF